MTELDKNYMRIAAELALKGQGWTSPNPMVGAVIVKDGRIIAKGWHAKYGDLHAERHALSNCCEDTNGADMYVTLEPCNHFGKQPPCTHAIVEAGIKRVFIGSDDPNELVKGKGIAYLRENGIQVITGVEKELCDSLNKIFFHYITTKRPYVTMKYAMSMDGKIATKTGESKWITGEKSREKVHRDRHNHRSIMVGVGTVLLDDPMLDARIEGARNPIRIICDTNLRTPLESRIVNSAREISTIIATAVTDENELKKYTDKGCQIVNPGLKDGHIDLNELMRILGEQNIDSILLEGGGTLNYSALKAKIVNRVQTYIGPMIIGGQEAKSPVAGLGIEQMKDKVNLVPVKWEEIDGDFYIESEVVACSQD